MPRAWQTRTSAAASGMTTVVVTGYLAGGYVPGPGYTSTENYDDITPESLNRMVQRMYDRCWIEIIGIGFS